MNRQNSATATALSPAPRPRWRGLLGLLYPRAMSPAGLAVRGVLVALFFGALHAAGLRDYTTVLTGTSPTGEPLTSLTFALGGLYVLAWLSAVALAPILLLAATLVWAWERRCNATPHK